MIIVLREMARIVPGSRLIGNDAVAISGLTYNSTQVTPGAAFVAITGFAQDGNRFVDDAVARGAAAVVTERESSSCPVPQLIVPDARAALADLAAVWYAAAELGFDLCGVTGTNGKTTTCFLTRAMMAAGGHKAGLITSLVYDTGGESAPATRTTPESLDIFRLLAAMKRNRCVGAVIEVSSHALALHRVRNVDFSVAAFTNFTRDHLDFHRDMDDYLAAKEKLLAMVGRRHQWAVINYDSPEFRGFIPKAAGRVMTYSLADRAADVCLETYRLEPSLSRFALATPQGRRQVRFHLPGRFNLYNALAATGAALALGIDLEAVIAALEQATVVPGRLERVAVAAPFTVFVDFAHTPDALRRTIEAMRELGGGRILTLFGCGGDRDRGKRPLMGATVTALSDYTVVTSDNPRSESPAAIIAEIKPGLQAGAAAAIIENRREAIAHILKQAKENDMVLIAGKGDEAYQEINGVKHPWSDREVVREELATLGFGG